MAGPAGPIDVAGRRARALLSCLALHAGEPVGTDRLLEWAWGARLPANPHNALQVQVSKLRKLLHPIELTVHGAGYRLAAARDEVDAHRFERLAAAGRDGLAQGRPDAAVPLLADAVGLWRGPALADVDHPDLLAARTRLEELRVDTVELWLAARLELAAGPELGGLVAELEPLCARHPLRERLWVLQITALARAGRQAEALRAYQEARRVHVEEIGIEPGEELRALEAAVLAQDPALTRSPGARGSAAAGYAEQRRDPAVGNLPAELTSFIGRAAELAAVQHLLTGEDRLVTLVGPGGAGKTRLALAAARAQAAPPGGGTWLVELAPVLDGADVATAVAATVGALEVGDTELQSGGAAARLRSFIARRPLLLVLDNCEHVIGDAARLVDELLRGCPHLRVLATSREGLGVPGERLWPVPPLDGRDAVELFVQRARAQLPGFDPDDGELSTITELCWRLDGLPLAVELAAARLRSLSLGELVGRLDDRFRLLTGGARSVLPRQQTLRALVDWSYDLLDEREQRVWQDLSILAGGCRLDAAEAICADEVIDAVDVVDLLAGLVEKSLVVVTRDEDGARYGLLQTIALYGREKLATSGRADDVRDRHLAFWATIAPRMLGGLQSPEQAAWMARLRADVENLRACVAWAGFRRDAASAMAIASGALWFFWLEGDAVGGRDLLHQALAIDPPPGAEAPAALRARTLAAAAWLDNYTESKGMSPLFEAVEAAEATGDSETIGFALLLAANHALHYGDGTLMAQLLERAEPHLVAADYRWGLAAARLLQAMYLGFSGRREEAALRMDEAMARFRAVGDRWGIGVALSEVADMAEIRGDYATAVAALEESRRLMLQSGTQPFDAFLQARLGNVLVLQGRMEEAEKLHEAAMAASAQVGLVPERAMTLVSAGFSRMMAGRYDEAIDVLTEAIRLGEDGHEADGGPDADGGHPRRVHIAAIAHARLGFIAEQQGRVDDARRHHLAGLAIMAAVHDVRGCALGVEGLAGVASCAGDPLRAAYLLGVAHGLRLGVGAPQPPAERALHVDRIEQRCRALLDDATASDATAFDTAAFDTAHAEGVAADGPAAVAALLIER